MKKEDLDPSKLTSIDERGDRVHLIPAEVRGYFRRMRTKIHLVLLVIFLALPWIDIGGRQSVLLDIPQRQFILFGVVFKAHETPLLFFLLAISTLGLAVVTSVWGRVWCGWACPQTVFIDAVYRRIEQWTEGTYLERRQMRVAPWTFSKFRKKTLKWILFFVVSSLIAHCFMAYFTGSRELIHMMQGNPSENWNYFLLVVFFTALVLFDFAWFREQFCVIMCPYGRIQAVLMDPSTLTVHYNAERGEPRRGKQPEGQPSGDCVSCQRCVQVCPTGIDIRNGLQMECIACTACIDACDEIMTKVNKPQGLISYATIDGSPFKIFKIRTLGYGLIILASVIGLVYNLKTREPVNIAVLRAIDTPYTVMTETNGDKLVMNHFRLHFTNQTSVDGIYRLELPEEFKNQGITLTVAQNPLTLKADSSETWHLFIKSPATLFQGRSQVPIRIRIQKEQSETLYERDITLIGPKL